MPGKENCPWWKDKFSAGPSGYCVAWASRVGFGNMPGRCRNCIHRPLYTDRCLMAERRDGGLDDGK